MVEVTETLEERGKRYGKFVDHARIAQAFKLVVRNNSSVAMEAIHWEAVDMILHKLARILNGDPNYADSWHDIAGYAILVEQHILKNDI